MRNTSSSLFKNEEIKKAGGEKNTTVALTSSTYLVPVDVLTPLQHSRPLSVFQNSFADLVSGHDGSGERIQTENSPLVVIEGESKTSPQGSLCTDPTTCKHFTAARAPATPTPAAGTPRWRKMKGKEVKEEKKELMAAEKDGMQKWIPISEEEERSRSRSTREIQEEDEEYEDEEECCFCIDPSSPSVRPRLSEEWRRKIRSVSISPRKRSSTPPFVTNPVLDPFINTMSAGRAMKVVEQEEEEKRKKLDLTTAPVVGYFQVSPGGIILHRSRRSTSSSSIARSDAPAPADGGDRISPSRGKDGQTAVWQDRVQGPLIRLDDTDDDSYEMKIGNDDDGEKEVKTRIIKKNKRERKEAIIIAGRRRTVPCPRETGINMPDVPGEDKGKGLLTSSPLIRLDDDDDDDHEEEEERGKKPRVSKSKVIPIIKPSVSSCPQKRGMRLRLSKKAKNSISTATTTSSVLTRLLFDRNRTSPSCAVLLTCKVPPILVHEVKETKDEKGPCSSSEVVVPALYAQRVALYHSLAVLFDPAAYGSRRGFQAAVAHTFSPSHILPPFTFWPLFMSTGCPPSSSTSRKATHLSTGSTNANPIPTSVVHPCSSSPVPVEYVGEGSFGLVWKASVSVLPLTLRNSPCCSPSSRNGNNGGSASYRTVCIKSCPLFLSTKAHREDAVTTLREVAILTLLQVLEEKQEENKSVDVQDKEGMSRTTSDAMRGSDSFPGSRFTSSTLSRDSGDAGRRVNRIPQTPPLYSAFYVPGAAEALPPVVRDAVRWRRQCQRTAEDIAAEELRWEEAYREKGKKKGSERDVGSERVGSYPPGGEGEETLAPEKGFKSAFIGKEELEEEKDPLHTSHSLPCAPPLKSFEARVEDILQNRLANIEKECEQTEEDKHNKYEEKEKDQHRNGRKRRRASKRRTPRGEVKENKRGMGVQHGFVTSSGEWMRCTAARERYCPIKCPAFLSLSAQDVLQCDGTLFMVMEYCHGDVEHLARQHFHPMALERSLQTSREAENPERSLLRSSSFFPQREEECTQEVTAPITSPTSIRLPSEESVKNGKAAVAEKLENQERGETEKQNSTPPRAVLEPRTTPLFASSTKENMNGLESKRQKGSSDPPPPIPSSSSSLLLDLSQSTVSAGGRINKRRSERSESPPAVSLPAFPNHRQRQRRKRRKWLRYWYRRPLPHDLLLSIASSVSEALAGLHALGLIHLDIKPSNILYTIHRHHTGEERTISRHKEHEEERRDGMGSGVSSALSFSSFIFYLSDFGNCQLLPVTPLPDVPALHPFRQADIRSTSMNTTTLVSQTENSEKIATKEGEKERKSNAELKKPEEREIDPVSSLPGSSPSFGSESAVSNAIGTYAYMDHPALAHLQASTATDCFSLGATLFELAFGRRIYGLVHQHRQVASVKEESSPFLQLLLPSQSHSGMPEERKEGGGGGVLTKHSIFSQRALPASQVFSMPSSMTLGLDAEEEEEKDREWYCALAEFYALHHHEIWSSEIINDELIGMVIRYFVDLSHHIVGNGLPHPHDPSHSSSSVLPLIAASPLCSSFTSFSSCAGASQQLDHFSSHNVLCYTTITPQSGTVSTAKTWLCKFFNEILYPLLNVTWGERMTAVECASRLQEDKWKQMLMT